MTTTLYTLAALYLLAALNIVGALNIVAALYGTTTTVLRVQLLAGVMLVAFKSCVVGSSAGGVSALLLCLMCLRQVATECIGT